MKIFLLAILLLFLLPASIQAGELIIKDGSTLTINSDSTLTMNCSNISLEAGSSFLTNDGTILSLGKIIDSSSGYINNGTVETCTGTTIIFQLGGVFYVINAGN
ncbi:MAG: hypothetical protein WGN25_02710 [Candidatus Electrothrix sp. GW3-4]|uniref:hypothetical protein n=1 Tax=Candidatus Electrothrix sp. GW3-4 TaxID=3126740 RepID=UPI0030D0EE48